MTSHVHPSVPDPDRPTHHRTAALQLAAAGILWGTGGVAGAALQGRSDVSAMGTAAWRLAVAAALLLGWHLLTRRPLRVPRRHLGPVVAVGLLLALFQACYFASVERLGVAVATLLTLGSAPVLVAAADVVGRRAAPSGRRLVALATALVGLGLVVRGSGPDGAAGTGDPLAGIVLAVVSAGGFAAVTVLSARLGRRVPPLVTTTAAMGVGALVLVPVAALGGGLLPPATAPDVALLLYLGLGPTALAYGLYLTGLRTADPGAGATAALLEPVTATLLAAVLLSERLGVLGVVGATAVVLAVALSAGPERTKEPRAARTMRR